MPLPEDYRPRKGDKLVLHVEVRHDVEVGEADVHFIEDSRYRSLARILPLDQFEGVASFCFEPEDRVKMPRGDLGMVVAVHENMVWVKTDLGAFTSVSSFELKRHTPPSPTVHGVAPAAPRLVPRGDPQD